MLASMCSPESKTVTSIMHSAGVASLNSAFQSTKILQELDPMSLYMSSILLCSAIDVSSHLPCELAHFLSLTCDKICRSIACCSSERASVHAAKRRMT